MEKRKDEQLIYLKDLFFAAMYRWRSILAVGIALALLLGTWKTVTGISALNAEKQTGANTQHYERMWERYEREKKDLEERVGELEEDVDNQRDYLKESQLMQMDPYGYYEVQLNLYVDTNYQILPGMEYQNPDTSVHVLNAYYAAMDSGDTLQALAQAIESRPHYLSETYTLDMPEDANLLIITAKCVTEAHANTLLQAMLDRLELTHTQVTQAIGEHTFRLLQQSVSLQVDMALVEQQRTENDRLMTLQEQLTDTEEQLANLEQPTVTVINPKEVIKDIAVFTVVGGILGAVMVMGWAWLVHICSGKVYSARLLTSRANVKVISCVPGKQHKNPIDRMLLRLEGRQTGAAQATAAVAGMDVRNRCPGITTLLVTGDCPEEARGSLLEALRSAMPGVSVMDKGSVLYSAEAMEALPGCDAVLLIEQCKASRYANVEKEACMIADYGKKLVGCVLLDG